MKMCRGPAFGCKQRANCDVVLPQVELCCLRSGCRQPLAASAAAFYKSYLLNSLYFCLFCFYFLFFFRFGASSRSRAVKYSWPCCVLKIRLISTPSLFSSSASPLSLPSVDEQQKHVYLARFARTFPDWTASNDSSFVRLQFDHFFKSPFASISGIKERNSAGKEGLMVKGRKERWTMNEIGGK